MLRDLTIQNYRCFNNFHIDGLARVNLLVGMNNCGKTTLLEAVYLPHYWKLCIYSLIKVILSV
ncbi:AAA family ATPase [Coleofasciculus chthonoplastes]|uniref:AAA family ATPase n=1 Tax=Coleofasciculus chthonoplastes TaxID=64178 RepID=UPI004063CF5A